MSNKLYTEEQVRIMLGKARLHNMDDSEMFTDDYLIEQQTPIELPTDAEISEVAMVVYGFDAKNVKDVLEYKAFKRGAKWMRDKIQGGNNGTK